VLIGRRCNLFTHLVIDGNMAGSCDHHCVIKKLIQTPFGSLSYNDKLKIIEEGALKLYLNIQYYNKNLHTAL
jgi:hypothetical protein